MARYRRKTSPNRISDNEKAQRALQLRIQGWQFDAIAKEVGYSDRSSAYNAVNRILKERAAQCAEDADELRAVELERLDTMLKALWPAVEAGEPASIDKAIKIQERRAKLLGLDAPAKQELSGPDGTAIKVDSRGELVSRIALLIERARAKRDPSDTD